MAKSAKTLGDQTTIYYDKDMIDNPGSPTTPDWQVAGCSFDITPPGYTYDVVEDELCLEDPPPVHPVPRVGDQQTDEITGTLAFDPESTVQADFDKAADEKLIVNFRIDYPDTGSMSPPDGGWRDSFTGQITVWKPESVTKREFMRCALTIIRQGAFTRAVQS